MKKYIIAFLFVFTLSACTHVRVSNPSLLETAEVKPKKDVKKLPVFPLHVAADMSCTSSQNGNRIRTSCSNYKRLNTIAQVFKERGLNARSSKDQFIGPQMSVQHDEINSFLFVLTRMFNFVSLGFLPEYDYDEYTVKYKDTNKNIDISESVTVSSTRSWISLFIPNEKGLSGSEMNEIAEKNLIHSVLEDAKVGE